MATTLRTVRLDKRLLDDFASMARSMNLSTDELLQDCIRSFVEAPSPLHETRVKRRGPASEENNAPIFHITERCADCGAGLPAASAGRISELRDLYQEFLPQFDVDLTNGIRQDDAQSPHDDSTLKFATLPYIGSQYGQEKRILIVGLDVGADEKRCGIQSFEERRKAIECRPLSRHNPHIAGTYFTALYFLKNSFPEWTEYWESVKKTGKTCVQALRCEDTPAPVNPLAHIALTNYFKFVSVGRRTRRGDKNRKTVSREIERRFFVEEVEAFKPEIIVFQGAKFRTKLFRKLAEELAPGRQVFLGPHPSGYDEIRYVKVLIRSILDERLAG